MRPIVGPGLAKTTPDPSLKQNAEEDVRRYCAGLYQRAGFRSQAHAAAVLGCSEKSLQRYLTTGPSHERIPGWFVWRLREHVGVESNRRTA